jgi:hypothetical protein
MSETLRASGRCRDVGIALGDDYFAKYPEQRTRDFEQAGPTFA